jgi:hypothetical protein
MEPLQQSDWSTPPFANIKKKKTKRLSPYLESELWERDEILSLIKYEPHKRNKAALALLWGLNARPNVRSPYMTCDKCGLMITGKLEVQGTQAGIPLLLIRFCLW